MATDLYAREGVDTTWLKRTKAMATGVGFIILNAEGENGIILDMGANELMDSAYVDQVEGQIARSDVVMSVLEIPVAAAARAMELGKKHGVRTILNPAPATALDGSVLQDVDYLTRMRPSCASCWGLRRMTPLIRLNWPWNCGREGSAT